MRTLSRKKKRPAHWQAIRLSVFLLLILLIISLASVLTGCKNIERGVASNSELSVYEKEIMVPFAVPSDSLTFRALFECDSLNNVLLRELSESKSKNMSSSFSFQNGVLDLKAQTAPDTVYVKQKEKQTRIKETVTITKTVKTTEYVRGFLWWSGLVVWISVLAFIAYKLSRKFRVFLIQIITFIK